MISYPEAALNPAPKHAPPKPQTSLKHPPNTLPQTSPPPKKSDPGQTLNTSVVLQQLIAGNPQILLLAGDFSYADDWVGADKMIDWKVYGTRTCEFDLV